MNAKRYVTSEMYRSGFMEFLARLARIHEWVKHTEQRRKWTFRCFVILAAVQLEIEIKGILYWSESRHWWEAIPLAQHIIKLILGG